MRLEEVVFQTIERWPARVAVVHRNRVWTYADLGAGAAQTRQALADAGLAKDDRVLLWMENSAEYIAAYLAVLQLGGIVVPLHAQVPSSEVVRISRHVGAVGLIVSPFVRQWTVEEFEKTELRFILQQDTVIPCRPHYKPESAPPGLAQVIYTSGSTGRPKGVMLSHRNLIANTRAILDYLRLSSEDSVMAVLPFVYAYGNSVMLTHLFAGGKLVIENSFVYPNLVLDRMVKEEITGFSGVATTYAILFNQSNLKAYSFPALRYLTHAGGPMPVELLRKMRSVFHDKDIVIMYGQTEAAARLTYLPPAMLDRKAGSAGRPLSGVSLKIIKEGGVEASLGEAGEVWASGENIMQGYWADPHATAAVLMDGWLRTGDIGSVDDEGYLTLVGRNSEMIKSGAFRISPTELEEVLLQHADVQEAGVVGVEDDVLGELICAVVVPKPDRRPTDQELLAFCAQRLAMYKRPKAMCVVDALPKSPSGKVLRQGLRDIGRAAIRGAAQGVR